MQRFADTYLDPAKLTVVMVATPETVKAQLADLPLGPVEVRAAPASAAPKPASQAVEPAPPAATPKPASKAAAKPAQKKAAGARK